MTIREQVSRREFLETLALGAGGSALLARADVHGQVSPPSAPQNPRLYSKTDLGPGDLTYLGYFRVPRWPFDPVTTVLSAEGDYCKTSYSASDYGNVPLGMRVVGGQRRFFVPCHNHGQARVLEIALPSSLSSNLTDTLSAPIAPTVDYWGLSVYGSSPTRRFTQAYPQGSNSIRTHGLFWDATTGVLWWSFGDTFNASGYRDPSCGYAKLTNPTGSATTPAAATAYGPWQIDPDRVSSQNVKGFIYEVPEALRPLVGGRRLAAGSVFTSILGPHDFGPVMIAFAPPGDSSTPVTGVPFNADRFKPSSVDVLRYGSGQPSSIDERGNYAYTQRARRPTDYSIYGVTDSAPAAPPEGWPANAVGGGGTSINPVRGAGYWHHCDVTSGAVWVETATRRGLVFTGGMGSGLTGYTYDPVMPSPEYGAGARIWSEYYHAVMIFYSLDDLIEAASNGYGHRQRDPVIWRVSGLPTNLRRVAMGAPAFDPEYRRLYAIQPWGWSSGEWHPIIHCWQVAE